MLIVQLQHSTWREALINICQIKAATFVLLANAELCVTGLALVAGNS